jgi:hypothetical protein
MFTKTKIALSAALVLGTAVTAFAAAKPHAAGANAMAAYNVIPGYNHDGSTVAIPDPNQR